jgi:hypothetical protein
MQPVSIEQQKSPSAVRKCRGARAWNMRRLASNAPGMAFIFGIATKASGAFPDTSFWRLQTRIFVNFERN